MSTSEAGTLALAGALTVATAPQQWRRLATALAGVETLDLGAVEAVDSAGVALVLALLRRAEQQHGRRPALRGAPARFEQLCVAHRVAGNGH